MLTTLIEYETPKVVTVHNVSIGLLRRSLQLFVVLYVGLYQLWYAQGYQEFSSVESSTTTKVKGYSVSQLDEDFRSKISPSLRALYERVWDEADYVVPPAENGAFFVTTNIVITPNQTLGNCPEDPSAPQSACRVADPISGRSEECQPRRHIVKSHGPQTGRCVPLHQSPWTSPSSGTVCEIQSWCPVEDDRLTLGLTRPLISGSDNHTVYIKNSIRFSYFGDVYHRNNLPAGICRYKFQDPTSWLCNIFRLGEVVEAAGGNYTQLSITGGVVAVHIQWSCNLDWDFMRYCLPKYSFRLLDTSGWNFRHAHYHEEGRRTLYKAYGIKFVIIVQGIAGKFSLKNTVINVVAGLGLISFITMFCDFILLNYVSERKAIKEKKFDVLDKEELMRGMMAIISVTNDVGRQKNNLQESRETIPSEDCYLEMKSYMTPDQSSLSREQGSYYILETRECHNRNHTGCDNV